MISIQIDPTWATIALICLSVLWMGIGYWLGYQDGHEDVFGEFEEETE